jgi:hypothetical protein
MQPYHGVASVVWAVVSGDVVVQFVYNVTEDLEVFASFLALNFKLKIAHFTSSI